MNDREMQSYHSREVSPVCLAGCCPCWSGLFCLPESSQNRLPRSRSTSAACRHDFETTTTSIFSNSHYTNHESLPSLKSSFSEFTKAYPRYFETDQVDQTRDQEYYHLSLSNHTCLDYIGIGLFSHSQMQKHFSTIPIVSSRLSSSLPPRSLDFTRFSISYKTGYLKTHLLHGGQESELESAMKRKIMSFLNISENDYCMVFTANKTSAFKLLAEAYPFQSSKKLLTVYDYESEAVNTMITSSEKKGARVMSAEFSWPRLRIHSAKLKKLIVGKRKKKKRGLFVFPLHSRITGTRYPYLWMSIAQENGWHVLLDACALGPKDMTSLGLSLFQPDFLVCSFYKVFGEDPSGFGCLFLKKSTIPVLETSRSSGIISIVPEKFLSDESSGADTELDQISKFKVQEAESAPPIPFSGPISIHTEQFGRSVHGETSEFQKTKEIAKQKGPEKTTGIVKSEYQVDLFERRDSETGKDGSLEIECRGLDQVDSLGLVLISNRARYLINWLAIVMTMLQHPNSKGIHLVRIYGPKVKFDRGPALAFNVFDWKGEKVEPVLVQKLADRSNISLSYGFLNHIWFPGKYEEEKARILEKRSSRENGNVTNQRKEDKSDQGIKVVTAALGFLANFEDVYRLWAFVAQFLDADFVEKERWRYTALNQKTIEV